MPTIIVPMPDVPLVDGVTEEALPALQAYALKLQVEAWIEREHPGASEHFTFTAEPLGVTTDEGALYTLTMVPKEEG